MQIEKKCLPIIGSNCNGYADSLGHSLSYDSLGSPIENRVALIKGNTVEIKCI